MQTDDIAAWLTAIWDEQEKAARSAVELTERAYPADEFDVRWKWARLTDHRTSGGGGQSFEPGAPTPTEVLARIAADREILALHTPVEMHIMFIDGRSGDWWCDTCGSVDDAPVEWPCETVRLLALPHAARPGYQEAWRPERLR